MPSGNHWFFGIGINRYAEFPALNNAVKDVEDVIETLSADYGLPVVHTITLFDEEASRKNIIDAFEKIADLVGEDDSLLIYYSGHGHLNKKLDMVR